MPKKLSKKQVWDTLKTPYDPRTSAEKFRDEMEDMIAEEIRKEIDKEILEKLMKMANDGN